MTDDSQDPSDIGYQANRRYRDELFRAIFSEPAWFVSLYNAIRGTNFTAADLILETTLSDPLFVGLRNDVSFLVGSRLVVFMEHQSTVSRNIALRMLVYASRTYEQIIDWRKVYGPQKITIPRPEFYVLYNGASAAPPVRKVRLSELFEGSDAPEFSELEFTLDLEVTIYNINIGNNPDLTATCEPLSEYQTFVELVNGFLKATGNLDVAMKLALDESVKRGLLTKYVSKPISEVIMTRLCDLTKEMVDEILWKEEIREEGHVKGLEEGLEKGMEKERKRIVSLIEQGVSLDDIKKILSKEKTPKKKRP